MTVRIGLDASLRNPSCAILSDRGVVSFATTAGNPIEDYPTVIREALFQAQLRLEDVEEIVACVGPGSYIGVRATVATANALALSLGLPVTGVLSVDVLATTAPKRQQLVVAFAAGRGRWYTASYRWVDDQLQRMELPRLVGDAPLDAWYAVDPDTAAPPGTRVDACGVLVVADQHRHLATETLVMEVASQERGVDNGN